MTMTNENIELKDPVVDDTVERPKFSLDVPNVEVQIDVSSNNEVQRVVAARMSKPKTDDMVKREAMTSTEIVEASTTEDEILIEEERGNVWLFDKIVTAVKGFRLRSEDKSLATEWREATPELLDLIPSTYKAAFIRGMYNTSAKLVETEDEGVVLGGDDILSVDFFVGGEEEPAAVIRLDIPEPSETERRKYASDAVRLRQVRGAKKSRNKIVANLGAAVKFFDALMQKPGADIRSANDQFDVVVGGSTFASRANALTRQVFLDAIDPQYKRQIVGAAMSRYNAKVQD
jgi:hypothetical protein